MKKLGFLIVGSFLVLCIFAALKYYSSYGNDLLQRPWAYSKDKNAKLFVGKWEGEFKDPDGVSKKMTLEIFVPLTDDDRLSKSFNKKSKSIHTKTKTGFDGTATVTSALGTENYEIWGGFEDTDFHKFHFNVATEKNLPVANFYLAGAKYGIWAGDQIDMTMPFNYRKANGAGFYQSSDPRFSQKAVFVMKRK